MKVSELITKIAEETGLTKKEVKKVFEVYEELVKKLKKEKDHIPLPGVGKFVVVKNAARTARNPKTGETVNIPEKLVRKFKVTKSLKYVE